jgi:MoxR-like ATPase
MGKTTLIRFMAQILGLKFGRIQFTNDLMPADILGVNVFAPQTGTMTFRAGPIFAELILADELNRASPKTQSALLQAMEERLVSVDGETYELPSVFTVMATQNPKGMSGTFSLPESQLDRFLIKFPMGYPPRQSEKLLIQSQPKREFIKTVNPLVDQAQLLSLQQEIQLVTVSDSLVEYVLRLLEQTRISQECRPLSPRAGQDIIRLARAWAWIHNRNYVIPDDVQALFPLCAGHRLVFQEVGCTQEQRLALDLMAQVSVI